MSVKAFIRPALIVMIVAFVWRYARSVIADNRQPPNTIDERD